MTQEPKESILCHRSRGIQNEQRWSGQILKAGLVTSVLDLKAVPTPASAPLAEVTVVTCNSPKAHFQG